MKTHLKRISCLAFASAAGLLHANTYYNDAANFIPKVKDSFEFAPQGAVELDGLSAKSMQTCLDGDILRWDIDDLLRPFQVRLEVKRWQIEFWGKWITSAELAYHYKPSKELASRLDYAVSGLLKTQASDGTITTYKKESELSNWDHWGRKYVMLGLLADFERTSNPQTLKALQAHADAIIKEIGTGKNQKSITKIDWWGGLAAGSILEPMALLYRHTNEQRYLDFCNYIVSAWEKEDGPKLLQKALANTDVVDMFAKPKEADGDKFAQDGKSKAYELMSCYEGLLEFYRINANPDYKKAVENVAKSIYETEITPIGSGSVSERWARGKDHLQHNTTHWMETCVTATWIKLCTQLLRLTGDPKYADYIETAYYNALIGAQKTDGTWWSHFSVMNGLRQPAPEHCNMHMNCCVASGPRALFLLPQLAFMSTQKGVVINFYEKAKAAMPIFGSTVELQIGDVDFVSNRSVKITLNKVDVKSEFEIKLRIPAWSKNSAIKINGEDFAKPQSGQYANISRVWKSGDVITFDLDASPRLIKDEKSDFNALAIGPFVYAQDKSFEPNFDKPLSPKLIDGKLKIAQIKLAKTFGAISLELADGSKRIFVPYAASGLSWDADTEFRIWFLTK